MTQALSAADWPQFLGPTRNNVAAEDEKPLPASFPSSGPRVLWQKMLGTGFAGPAVAAEIVVVFHREKDDAVVEALDSASGLGLWRFNYHTPYRDSFGFDNGPRATPTIVGASSIRQGARGHLKVTGGKVFTHGAEGIVTALDLSTGKLLWQVDTAKVLGSPQGYFGRACAPLVVGDLVIVTPGGGTGKAVVALNIADGSVKWSAGDDEASYSSPVLASDGVLVCWLRNNLTTFNLADGKALASEHYRPEEEASVSSAVPIKTDHGWFLSAEYGVGASLWDIAADGKLSKTWSGDGLLDSHYATPVFANGYVYGFTGRQERGQSLCCLSTDTHKVAWTSPSAKGGMVLRVKDKLLAVTESGELWIVSAKPGEFDQTGVAQILRSGHRSYPAYSNGVLYARDGEKMVAVQLAK